jgi:hypothetical protein
MFPAESDLNASPTSIGLVSGASTVPGTAELGQIEQGQLAGVAVVNVAGEDTVVGEVELSPAGFAEVTL